VLVEVVSVHHRARRLKLLQVQRSRPRDLRRPRSRAGLQEERAVELPTHALGLREVMQKAGEREVAEAHGHGLRAVGEAVHRKRLLVDAAADADAVERDLVDRAAALERLGRLVLHADDEDAGGLQRGCICEAHVGKRDFECVRRPSCGAGREQEGDRKREQQAGAGEVHDVGRESTSSLRGRQTKFPQARGRKVTSRKMERGNFPPQLTTRPTSARRYA